MKAIALLLSNAIISPYGLRVKVRKMFESTYVQNMKGENIMREKFIPYEKLSKKEQKKQDTQKRLTWGAFNPVTRTKPNGKIYSRARVKANQLRAEY